jgi:hypothetical protein
MKLLIFLFLQIYLAAGQAVPNVAADVVPDASFCLIGTVATLPPKPWPVACLNPNEVFACAYGEARCDGLGYCGTPPCTWR